MRRWNQVEQSTRFTRIVGLGCASPDWIVLKNGDVLLSECNVRWTDTTVHDTCETEQVESFLHCYQQQENLGHRTYNHYTFNAQHRHE